MSKWINLKKVVLENDILFMTVDKQVGSQISSKEELFRPLNCFNKNYQIERYKELQIIVFFTECLTSINKGTKN